MTKELLDACDNLLAVASYSNYCTGAVIDDEDWEAFRAAVEHARNESNRRAVGSGSGITLKATADGSWLYRYVKSHCVYYQINEKGFLEYWTGAKWLRSKYAYNFTVAA